MDIQSFQRTSSENGLDVSQMWNERRFQDKSDLSTSLRSSCVLSCKYCLNRSSNSLSRVGLPSKHKFAIELSCSLCCVNQFACLVCARCYINQKELNRHFNKQFHQKRIKNIVATNAGELLLNVTSCAEVPDTKDVAGQNEEFFDDNSPLPYQSDDEFDVAQDASEDEEDDLFLRFDPVNNPDFSQGMVDSINRHKLHNSITQDETKEPTSPGSSAQDSSAVDLLNIRLVVGKALGFRTDHDASMIHPLDASLHVIFTSFMEGLTQKKQDDLLFILRLNDVVKRETADHVVKTTLPLTRNDLDRSYLKGLNSIKKNLNGVGAYSEKGFAYSLVKHYVDALMIRFGPCNSFDVLDGDEPEIVKTALESKRARQLLREMRDDCIKLGLNIDDVVPILLAIWDDGFDPSSMNNGIGSLNACTVSAVDFAVGNISRLNAFTDVVSLSRSSEDHDAVLGKLLSELRELKHPFRSYHKQKGECYAIVRVLNCNRDRVQRNKVNFTLAHNGNCTQRWKYVIPPKGDERQKFFACEACVRRSLNSVLQGNSDPILVQPPQIVVCTDCGNFDVECQRSNEAIIAHDCPTSLLKYSPTPPNYVPISTTNRTRHSFQHRMCDLISAVKTATYNLCLKNWSAVESDAYLREVGINGYVMTKVRKCAKLVSHLTNDEIKAYLLESQYTDVVPNVWNFEDVCDIDSNIDPIMHMVFEGIIKVIIKEVFPNAFSLFGVKKKCMDLIQNQLILLQGMSIEWIRTERLSKKNYFQQATKVITLLRSLVFSQIVSPMSKKQSSRKEETKCTNDWRGIESLNSLFVPVNAWYLV